MDKYTLIATIVGSLLAGGGLTGIVVAIRDRKKTAAEAESTLSTAILAYSNKLTADNDKLRGAVDELEHDMTESRKRFEKDADASQKRINQLRADLSTAEEHARSLKDIVASLEARKVNDQTIISKLVAALRQSDPNNPVLAELASLSEFHLPSPAPSHP